MNFIKTMAVFISAGIAVVNGAGAITGRVVNGSPAALADVKAWLKNSPSVMAYTDTDSTCMQADSLGIKHATDFTTKTSGGHTFPFRNEVVRKYAADAV